MVKFRVDDNEIEAKEGTNLLQACLDNGIYIPNLCHLEHYKPSASCRMCFVEVIGESKPVPSCTLTVTEGVAVKTDTPAVRRLQRTALRLLLSVHAVDCVNCPANRKCELQRIAKFLKVGLKPKELDRFLKPDPAQGHPVFNFYPNRCVLCRRCIQVCRQKNGRSLLSVSKRGMDTMITAYEEDDIASFSCPTCSACVDICPTAAISFKAQP